MTKGKRRELVERATRLYEARKLDEAEALCRQVLSADEDEGEAWFRLGWVARRRGRLEQSVDAFRRAVACDGNDARFHNGLGAALMGAGRLAEAVASYRKSLDLEPSNAETLGNLARAQWLLGDLDAAEANYRKSVTLGPTLVAAYYNYGKLLRFRGKCSEAVRQHLRATQLAPEHPKYHLELGLDYMGCQAYAPAADSLARAVNLRHDDSVAALLAYALYRAERWADAARRCDAVLRRGANPEIRLVLSQCLYRLGKTDEALAECRRVMSEAPQWATARFIFETMSAPDQVRDVPEEVVTALFDGYADLFDDQLVQQLKYRAPQLLLDAFTASSERRSGLSVMDGGCGTGLCGELFKPFASRLAGVDLSPRMIEKARARGVYDELVVGDLVHALRRHPEAYDVVIAADVMIYVGDMEDVVAAARDALRGAGGLLAFTLEAHHGDEPFVLRPSRRFAHSLRYVRELAGKYGMNEVRAETAVLRREGGADIEGFVVVLRK